MHGEGDRQALRPAAKGLGPQGQLQPSPADRCPVCGMRPARHPKNAAAVVLRDGRTFYFCSNRGLVQALRQPDAYLGIPGADIAQAVVLDYFSGQPIDAQAAHWVTGSDVVGPMGRSWVTLRTASDAERFVRRHGRTHQFQLEDLDEATWHALTQAQP